MNTDEYSPNLVVAVDADPLELAIWVPGMCPVCYRTYLWRIANEGRFVRGPAVTLLRCADCFIGPDDGLHGRYGVRMPGSVWVRTLYTYEGCYAHEFYTHVVPATIVWT